MAALREAIAAWYARWYGVRLDPGREILPLLGSKEGISHIAFAYLEPGNVALATAIASLPEKMRGYGPVKARNVEAGKQEQAALLAQFRAGAPAQALAAE